MEHPPWRLCMQAQDRLPLDEQVDEVKATSEDRLAAVVVPALERLAAVLTQQAGAIQDRFTSNRRQA